MTDIVPDDQIDGGPIDKGPPVLTAAEQQLAFAREERDWYEAGREKALARVAALETALIERDNNLALMRVKGDELARAVERNIVKLQAVADYRDCLAGREERELFRIGVIGALDRALAVDPA